MELYDAETANKFKSRPECQSWIKDRIVRFRLKMIKTRVPGVEVKFTYVPQKFDGKIININSDGFEDLVGDEPLNKYASPVKKAGEWLAVMRLQEG